MTIQNRANEILDQMTACADKIIEHTPVGTVYLLDGDKTITVEDTSNKILGYSTHLYDGNFYTGYQAWKQRKEFDDYICPDLKSSQLRLRKILFESYFSYF